MSTHVTEDRLLAHLDGELPSAEARAVEEHLAACAECTSRFDAIGRRAAGARQALRRLDVPPPWTEMPEPLRAAARASGARETVRAIGSARSRRRGPWWRRPIAVAAGLVLLAAAGASAIPGSPLRAWIADSAAAIVGLFDRGPARPQAPASPMSAEAGTAERATISVRPAAGGLSVTVRGARAGSRVRIRAVDAEQASASAASARYEVGPGRLEVLELDGELLVTLPANLREAAVEVNGWRVAELRDGTLRRTAAADSLGAEILVEVEG